MGGNDAPFRGVPAAAKKSVNDAVNVKSARSPLVKHPGTLAIWVIR